MTPRVRHMVFMDVSAMICETCHGQREYWNGLLGEKRPCPDCGGCGITHCCEGLTHGVIPMLTNVAYWYDKETPDNTGWYICHYDSADDLLAKSPYDSIGPYDTEAEAKRVLTETSALDDSENTGTSKRKVYDPSRDPTPASLDAGIPTDNDFEDNLDDAFNDTDETKSVQLELQQTQELRDVPPKVQGD